MSGTHRTFWCGALLLVGLFIFPPGNTPAGSNPLTNAEIETTMAVREMADALRLEGLEGAGGEKSGEQESFAEIMAQVQQIGHEADRQACDEFGIAVPEYRDRLRRLIRVGELVFFEDVKAGLGEELRQRRAKTESDLIEEAEQSLASTETWYEGVRERTAGEAEKDQGTPELPGGYSDSLEQIVVEPMRQKAADGKLPELLRQANEKRCKEIRGQLSIIDQQLSTPPMRQAAADKPAVLALLDREILQGLSTSLVEDIPLDELAAP